MIPKQTRREHQPVIGYVNAGGRGSRLSELFDPAQNRGVAKALLEIGTPPLRLVDHHINRFKEQGIHSIVIAAGDHPEVAEYVRDTHSSSDGVGVTESTEQLGTGGDAVVFCRSFDGDQTLMVQNVDTILDIDTVDFIRSHRIAQRMGAQASIALTRSRNVPNQDAFSVGTNGQVTQSFEFLSADDNKRATAMYRASSTGAVMVSTRFLRNLPWHPRDGQLSLYRDCLRSAWENHGLYSYDNGIRFFRDIGTKATWLASVDDSVLQAQLCYSEETSNERKTYVDTALG